jgi:magnesium chelatase subunit H
MNFIRKHALAYQAQHGGDLETAALRVFGNAEGAYGANVNQPGRQQPLGRRRRAGRDLHAPQGLRLRPQRPPGAAGRAAAERAGGRATGLPEPGLGRAGRDHHRHLLRHAGRHQPRRQARQGRHGARRPVYIGDQTRGRRHGAHAGEQVALETRTRMLNPKWYEGMLEHGYEGVRQIEVHVTNTMGWSATTGQVQPWVYQQLTETFVLDPAMRERLAQLNPTPRPRWPTACWKRPSAVLEARRPPRWTRCARRRRTRRPPRRRLRTKEQPHEHHLHPD